MAEKRKMNQEKLLEKSHEALKELVNIYVANRGSKHEFISCVTPPHASAMTFSQRRSNTVWRAFDNAIEVIEDIERVLNG